MESDEQFWGDINDGEQGSQLAENNIPVEETLLQHIQPEIQDEIQQGSSSRNRENILEISPNRQSRKRKTSEQEFYRLAVETPQCYNRVPQDDHFAIAGKKIASEFRSLDHRQFLLAEKIIQDVIYHAKFGRPTENDCFKLANVNKDT